jgi:CheY-like chemotaxis protein
MKQILIVDDEQIVLDVLQRIVSRLGYNAVVSDSGKTALERFDKHVFDLVLMDVLMPDKNGFEIARQMKKKKPDQKIVMVTGLGIDADITQQGLDTVEVDSVLSKPFSYDRVKSVVDNAMQGSPECETEELEADEVGEAG